MIKKTIVIIVDVISVAIISVSVLLLLLVFLTKPGQPPQVFGFSVFRVVTGSMEPSLPVDTLLLVQKTDPAQVQVGDVITFYSTDPSLQGAVNTHRVVSIENNSGSYEFYTKGDANSVQDRYTVHGSNLIGVTVAYSHLLGVLARLFTNPLFALVVIGVPLLFILISSILRTVRIAKKMAIEEDARVVTAALKELRQAQQPPEDVPQDTDSK